MEVERLVLQPVIELGDYKAIRVAKDAVTVDEKRIEETITSLRRQYGTVEPVERAAKDRARSLGLTFERTKP